MKKLFTLLMILVFTTTATYGNLSDNEYTITYTECDKNINYALVNCPNDNVYLNPISTNLVSTDLIVSTNIDRQMNDDLKKTMAHENHLNELLKRKRLHYQLHKTKVLGQLTSPLNTETNHHKLKTPRMDGFGIKLRF